MLIERGAPAELMERTEAVIAREEAKAWAAIAPYKPRFEGKKVLLITGGVKSWSVVAALAGSGSRNRRHQRQEVDQGRQGAHQGADGPGRPYDRRYDAARNVQDAQGSARRHHALGRPLAVHRAQGQDALARHQPGAASRLYGLCRHGRSSSRRSTRRFTIRSGSRCASRRPGKNREELAKPRDGAGGSRGGGARRRSREGRRGSPREKDLQLQERRTRRDRGCDPREQALDGRGRARATNASGGCGACAVRIEEILDADESSAVSPRSRRSRRTWRASPSARRPARSIRSR